MSSYYELEIDKIKEMILKKQYKRILLQMPQGMLDTPLQEVVEILTPLGSQIIVEGDPSYGVCDLAINKAIQFECDLLIHFGHNEFGFHQRIHSKSLDILLIPSYVNFEISSYFLLLSEKLAELGWNKVGLVATIQHLRNLKELKTHLDSIGINCFVQKEGQILGCNINTIRGFPNQVDGIISLHAGYFHTYGLLLSTPIPILQLDPFTGEIKQFSAIEREKLIRKRNHIITQARTANVWGIIGSSKLGQHHPYTVSRIEKILQDHNKSKILLIAENINLENLENFTWVDAWVDSACPRLAIDDHIYSSKPIVTFKEFLYLFEKVTWEELLTTGFF
ncbi:MAG: diphthamide biosynthesis enzyme Dph2 [Candidatus Heimdallarchaeota archaeon]|nr:MAG: diphthamide biosynthesis enzyme Dph2 [Candidatus Heimdallarchaeota archaeon]